MSRYIFQVMALFVVALSLCGCPLLNPLLAEPEGAFEASPTEGEAPLTVLFVDASEAGTTNITEWQWDFGDGSTSTSRNPSHIYENSGLYTVSLTVTTSVGTHTALKRDYINVVQAPTADFTALPVLGNAPLTVNFSDTSEPGSSPIIDWQWNFGDRTPTSAEENPVHIYDQPGLYTVSLTVTTAVGSDRVEKVQFVNVAGNPTAAFETDVTRGTPPLSVTFTDRSDAGTAEITGWSWDFGDGGMSMEPNPTYVYAAPGVYTVSLTIETEIGEDTVVRENLITVDEGPTAAFSGEPVMGSAPLTVAFADESSAGSQAITKWLWDFGDGGLLSTRQNPTRVYNVPGVYTVSLRVTSAVGSNFLEQEDYVTVLPGVAFTANQTTGTGSLTVQFVDQSPVGDFEISAWMWDFGDGGMSTDQNPEHTFEEPGVYDVSLTITTELGDSTATETGLITVSPQTAFSAAPLAGPPPLEVTFTDETVAGSFEISARAWDFGDGGTSDEESPVHSYETPGVYTVSLQTTTEAGTTSRTKTGNVRVSPVVAIGADTTTGQGSLAVSFSDLTEAGNLNILGWFWDFGDGMSSTEQNPKHTYQNIGTYSVSLRVTTALGDTTATEMDFINVGPNVDFSSDVQSGEGTLSVKFADLTQAGSLDIEAWAWEFGDGATSDEQNPTHEYMPGQYSVSLTVTTSQGDTTTTKEDLILVAPMVAIDNVQPQGPAPFEASLLDITMPGMFEITGWEWNFGDGQSSTEQNPVHVFEDPGTYTVTLTISTDGGSFSVTEKDFITAQRGPTAMFSESITPGGSSDDPVTVAFTNMSQPGDSPILNQTWDFGESAIFAEEDAEEENPTVTYPGEAFATIPQDVSLTVRTFIAEDTLLKENIFGAKSTKNRLTAESLWEADFHALAVNQRGDVWAAGHSASSGTGSSVVLTRMDPAGVQRWGMALSASEGTLSVAAIAAAEDGTVILTGSLKHAKGVAAYLACVDPLGAVCWERVVYGIEDTRGVGICLDGEGGFVAAALRSATGLKNELLLLRGDMAGESISLVETGHLGLDSPVSVASTSPVDFLIGYDDGSVLKVSTSGAKIDMETWIESGRGEEAERELGVLGWDGSWAVLDRTVATGTGLGVMVGDVLRDEIAGLGVFTAHTLQIVPGVDSGVIIWLERDYSDQRWVVRRHVYLR